MAIVCDFCGVWANELDFVASMGSTENSAVHICGDCADEVANIWNEKIEEKTNES